MRQDSILSEEWEFHIGKKVSNIISIAIDAPQDVISTLSGKIGRLRRDIHEEAYSNIITKAGE